MMGKDDKVVAVRDPLWHNLQELLSTAPSRIEAEQKVHAYQVIREPLYRKVYNTDLTEEFVLHEQAELNVRSDTGRAFGVVRTERPDIQPAQVWDMAEFVMDNNDGVVVETAGTYNEGADMYILLKYDKLISIAGDKFGDSYSYLAFQNAYYEGKALRVQPTNMRIGCANMSAASDMIAEQRGINLSLSHVGNMRDRIEELKDFMAAWETGIQQWRLAKEYMASVKVTTEQTNWFIEQFIPAPAEHLTSDRVKQNIEDSRSKLVFELFNDFNRGIMGTALGLFEAASSYDGHVRDAQTPLTRFKRAVLTPTSVLADAHDLALEAATV
jgi:phage/plasmid-like protein (TIGR03299 family)